MLCFSLSPFTQHGSTGSAHFGLLGKASQCQPHLQLPCQGVARGSSPYPWQSTQDFWEQSLLWRASAGPGCSSMASQSSLAFAALGLSPSCSSLALFPCFALDLSSLSSPFQPPFPLPFWHCPPSDPRDFSEHSRTFSLVTLESLQVWVVRLILPRSAAPSVQLAALPEQ